MTTMSRNFAPFRAALAVAGMLLALPAAPAAARAGACPPARPVVSGPSVVNIYQGYSLSWTNVLADRVTSQPDVFIVDRSEDATFNSQVESFKSFKTTQTSASWSAPGGSPRTLYHRVSVQSYCSGSTPVRVDSVVFPVRVTDQCPTAIQLPAPTISPAEPPAFTTYIVSWDTLGIGEPGPGGGAEGLHFRLRRTSPTEVKETLNDTGTAAFADGPGEYVYEVRTENACGAVSAWSTPVRVLVGLTKTSVLVLVSSPKPILATTPSNVDPTTSFTVRNAGSEALDVVGANSAMVLSISPASFRIESGETRTVDVTVHRALEADAPLHTDVTFSAKGVSLRVPIDAALAAANADGPVGWDEEAADIDRNGNGLWRNLVNPGSSAAAIVTSVSAEWVVITTKDGKAWDRPLAPRETRPVWIGVDRSRRRSAIGTEVGTVNVETAGHPEAVKSLSVADDGPPVGTTNGPTTGGDLPPLYLMKSRLLFPSLPNSLDALGVGRYTSDVWLSNVDAVSSIQVLMTLTPTGQANTSSSIRQFRFTLGAGETLRFRNVIGTVFGFEGACSLDISSPAASLSAAALVNNKPIAPLVAGKTAALGTAIEGTLLTNAEFGFEMRPVAAGEGARAFDPIYVVSGLWHDGKRRTNLILRETTGNQTVVKVELFDSGGNLVLRNGSAVSFEIPVPALGSLQINDDALFPTEAIAGAVWVRLEFRQGVIDGFGRNRGAVVPFATVIDSGTQDASLRVGVSTAALTPIVPATSGLTVRTLAAGVPFGDGPESVFFPVARVQGASLSSGIPPLWRTRATFTNVNANEGRTVRLRFRDATNPLSERFAAVLVARNTTQDVDDVLGLLFGIADGTPSWGAIEVDALKNTDGTWSNTWADVDIQTETYTKDTDDPTRGEFRTGMEAYSYRHGYSSFQSNLGTVLIDGAEISPRNRTNLILEEVGGAPCTVAVAVYRPGALVPIAMRNVSLKKFDYISRELFRDLMQLDLAEIVDARVVVRQIDGDGVFMAFVSKINLVTGDPANVFLRPASAGTGR
jgi:hypothetical protein